MAKSWNKFGVDITLPGQEKIIKWGQKTGKDTTNISTKLMGRANNSFTGWLVTLKKQSMMIE